MKEANKVALCVQFRNESEFKTQLEAAEGDGRLTYTRWLLWKAPVQTSGDRPASPSQTVTTTDPSDTPPERPAPIGTSGSTPDAGNEASQPVNMYDPIRNK